MCVVVIELYLGGDTRGGAPLLTLWSSRAIRRGRAVSGRRQTWLGDVRVVRAEGLGSGAWVARRLACGGGWDFARGGHRHPARALLVDPSGRGSRRTQLVLNHHMA